MNNLVRLGTRGSPLARTQTQMVQATLQQHQPEASVETLIIRTTGDQWALQPTSSELPTDKGMFTKELEAALLEGDIDLAIHSLKDLPVEGHSDLDLLAILPRANPQDVLISRVPFPGWPNLPDHARIATGSLRRVAQLLFVRPDLQLVDIRGNIDTRLRKLRENSSWFGIVLAAAGLERLRPEMDSLFVTPIEFDVMLPAPGQGAIALQGRRGDQRTRRLVASLHCASTQASVEAERAFLLGLGGGCRAPIGAFASTLGSELLLQGVHFADPLGPGQRSRIQGPIEHAKQLGQALAVQILGE